MNTFFSMNFKYSEIMCPCGCKKINPIDPKLIYLLQELRDKLGEPIYISSGGGLRCKKYNKRIGGYIDSPHMAGKAVDIHVKDMPIVSLAKQAKKIGFSRVALYPYERFINFIHVDVVEPYPSTSWVRNKKGIYVYFKTLQEAVCFMETTKEKV